MLLENILVSIKVQYLKIIIILRRIFSLAFLLSNIINIYFSGMEEEQELIFFKATPSTQVKIYFQY